jgi:hypothetical protein
MNFLQRWRLYQQIAQDAMVFGTSFLTVYSRAYSFPRVPHSYCTTPLHIAILIEEAKKNGTSSLRLFGFLPTTVRRVA